MSVHVCRDFLSWANVDQPSLSLYVPSLFLRRVMNFTVVGQTNFDLDGATMTKGSGNSGILNLGVAGQERYLQIPSASYAVSVSDVNRIVAIRSNANPLLNSGLFRITAVDSATNSLVINNRSPDSPIADTSLQWSVHEREDVVAATVVNGANALATNAYHAWGSATTSRIILQSPHSTAWQVRVCQETVADFSTGIGAKVSFACGLGGNSAGDFAPGGQHLHVPLWFNSVNAGTTLYNTNGTAVGLYYSTPTPLSLRYYMWGDSNTGSVYVAVRQHGSTQCEGNVMFGICEDEEQPVPASAVLRLFNFGNNFSSAAIQMKAGIRTSEAQSGFAFGFSGQPISCVPTTYSLMPTQAQGTTIYADANASDSIFIGATELHGFDMITGTWDVIDSTVANAFMVLEPRRMGRAPHVRRGRENYPNFSTSTDTARSYLHLESGVYLPWSGSILP